MTSFRDDPIPSPCIKACRLDAAGTHCTGCRRSLAEIAGWPGFDAEQKLGVWQRLAIQMPEHAEKRCQCCGALFSCGSGGQDGGCWCGDLPRVLPLQVGSDCLCPACLQRRMADERRKRGLPTDWPPQP